MAQGYKGMMVAFLLAGLFMVSMINFAVLFQEENGANTTILSNQLINDSYNNLNTQLGGAQSQYRNQSDIFAETEPQENQESLLVVSIAGAWNVFSSIPVAVYDLTVGLLFDSLLGNDSNNGFGILLGTFGAIITLSIVLYAWKLIRTGDPD